MKLKNLTYAEFTALHQFLALICTSITPKGIEAQVLHGVLFRMYRRFYTNAIRVKKKYTISIEADEACAFWMFTGRYDMWQQDEFTKNLVRQINNSIHQKYSS
ncbi:MAG: hypothetical protein ACT4OJ_04965 [Bacteroidota bacterium]